MTRNFHKPNHTRASTFNRQGWKRCAYCRRRFPRQEFVTWRYSARQGAAYYLQGPRQRWYTVQHAECSACRRRPWGFDQWSVNRPGTKTPIRYARAGLPWPPPR